MDADCPFCRIVAGLAPASIVYQDEATVAFMDINPVTRGHTLVIPREHVENAYGLTDGQAAAMLVTGARVARAAKRALAPVGVNFWMANERPAGQVVMHAHLHVIPRYAGDGIGLRHGGPRSEGHGSLDDVAALIRAGLDGAGSRSG